MKDYKNSICFKVDQSLAYIEAALKKGKFNPLPVVELLHKIRQDAQKMEEGLKIRKQIMETNKLEDNYQKTKGNLEYDNTVSKTYINAEYRLNKKADFEIIIKDSGKVIYHNHDFAGIICTVQEVTDIAEDGTISGQCQKLYFGHDWSVFFAFDQLEKEFEDRKFRIVQYIHQNAQLGLLKSPEVRKRTIQAMNNILPINL